MSLISSLLTADSVFVIQVPDITKSIYVEVDMITEHVNSNVYIVPSMMTILSSPDIIYATSVDLGRIFKYRLYTNDNVFIISQAVFNQMLYAVNQQVNSQSDDDEQYGYQNGYQNGNQDNITINNQIVYVPNKWSNNQMMEFLDILDMRTIPNNVNWLSIFTLSEFLDVPQLEKEAIKVLSMVQNLHLIRDLPDNEQWTIYLYVPYYHLLPVYLKNNVEFMKQWLISAKPIKPIYSQTLWSILPKGVDKKPELPYDILNSNLYQVYGIYYHDNVLAGFSVKRNDDDNILVEGTITNNKLDGNYYVWWPSPNHTIRELTHFTLGIKDGPTIHWYRNGIKSEQRIYDMGVPVGKWSRYDLTGNLTSEYNFGKR